MPAWAWTGSPAAGTWGAISAISTRLPALPDAWQLSERGGHNTHRALLLGAGWALAASISAPWGGNVQNGGTGLGSLVWSLPEMLSCQRMPWDEDDTVQSADGSKVTAIMSPILEVHGNVFSYPNRLFFLMICHQSDVVHSLVTYSTQVVQPMEVRGTLSHGWWISNRSSHMTFSLSECFLRENYLGSKIPHHTLSIFLVVFVIFYHCFAVTKIRCTIPCWRESAVLRDLWAGISRRRGSCLAVGGARRVKAATTTSALLSLYCELLLVVLGLDPMQGGRHKW